MISTTINLIKSGRRYYNNLDTFIFFIREKNKIVGLISWIKNHQNTFILDSILLEDNSVNINKAINTTIVLLAKIINS